MGTKFQVVGREIYKDGKPFQIKGYNYTNTPIGQGGSYCVALESRQIFHDIRDMQTMGINCLRAHFDDYRFNESSTLLTALHAAGIYVIANYSLPLADDLTNAAVRARHILGLQTMVTTLKRFPHILGYCVASETGLNTGTSDLANAYSFVNQLVDAGRAVDPERIFTIAEADTAKYLQYKHLVPSVDAWSFNVYRGATFGSFVSEVRGTTEKPIIISEWGYNRLNTTTSTEQEDVQATRVVDLARQVDAMYPDVCGGLAFQWADAWWKSGNHAAHDLIADEWWGHNEAVVSGNDAARPRKAAFTKLSQCYRQGINYGIGQLSVTRMEGDLDYLRQYFKKIRITYPNFDSWSVPYWQDMCLRAKAKGFDVMWGVSCKRETSNRFNDFLQTFVDLAPWAAQNDITFGVNEEMYHNDDAVISDAEVLKGLHWAAREAKGLCPKMKLIISLAGDGEVDKFIAGGDRGAFDYVGVNQYGSLAQHQAAITKLVAAYGPAACVTEFNTGRGFDPGFGTETSWSTDIKARVDAMLASRVSSFYAYTYDHNSELAAPGAFKWNFRTTVNPRTHHDAFSLFQLQ